ncbi:MAG: hypothetical protein MK008_01515 [Bdellovibrionales bacterium]|nr:hypothetical protein [Bdellovibrionales bacterium]
MNQHKFQILALFISTLVLANPETSVENEHYRGVGPKIVISSKSISPAAAALEDSRYWEESKVVVRKPANTSNSIEMKAGEKEADRVIPDYDAQAKYKPLKGIKLNYAVFVAKQNKVKKQQVAKAKSSNAIKYQQAAQPIKIVAHKTKNQTTTNLPNNSPSSNVRPSKEGVKVASNDQFKLSSFDSVRAQGNIQLMGLPMVFEDQVVELFYEQGMLQSPINYQFPTGFDAEVTKGQGKIVAKLWSKSNGLIGEGELPLEEDLDYSRLQVLVKPVSYSHSGLLMATNEAATDNDYEIMMDANSTKVKVENSKFDFDMDVKSQPLMIAKLKDQKTSTLFSFNHKSENTWPIYTDDYALFLANLLNKRATALETTALIAGKVTYQGKPLSNVKLVVHQGLLEKPVTYFSSSLPNPSLKTTSSSGDFVAATEIDRPAAISVLINDKVVHRRDIPVGLGQVTHVNIEIGPQQNYSYELSSAFDRRPLDADLYIESSGDNYPIIGGEGRFYNHSSDMAERIYVDMKNSEYISYSTWINSDFKYGDLYSVKKSWFYELTKGAVENFNDYSSIYIGFVNGADYKVSMDSKANSTIKIIYFDSQGNKIESGKSDGGFIIVNMPQGQRTIFVEALDLNKSHSQFFNAYQSQNFSSVITF